MFSCYASTMSCVDAAHVLPLAFTATTPAKYCYRAIATFIKHVTNMPPTASLQQHEQPRASTITETVISPDVSSPLGDDGPTAPSQVKECSPLRSESLSRKTRRFRQRNDASEDILFAGDPIVYHGGWASQVYYHPKYLTAYYADDISGSPGS
jgi:hypothetical protein